MGEKPNARMIAPGMLGVVHGSSIRLTSIGDSHPFRALPKDLGPARVFLWKLNHSFHHF